MKEFTRRCISKYLNNFKSTINSKAIEEKKHDQCKKTSVFKDLQDGSKYVALMVYDLAI